MNDMTFNSQFAPWNHEDYANHIYCNCCGQDLDVYEALDPCEIDSKVFCDSCASDLIQLKWDGYIGMEADKTKCLKITEDIFETLNLILKPNNQK